MVDNNQPTGIIRTPLQSSPVPASQQAKDATIVRLWHWIPVGVAAILLVTGLAGYGSAAGGYGLFIISGLLLLSGLIAFSLFAFSPGMTTPHVVEYGKWLLILGGYAYVLAAAMLAGYYGHEALLGRVSTAWVLFGFSAFAALVVLDVGIYRRFIKRQIPTWRRYRHVMAYEDVEQARLRHTFVHEIVLHSSLLGVSKVRWLRHTLIFWGFCAMFGFELVAVVFREALPAFGLSDIYADFHHPLRAVFTFAFNVTGLMVLVGCALALVWRVRASGRTETKYADTPSTIFLLLVTLSGFLVQAYRIASMGHDPDMAIGFLGYGLSFLFSDSAVIDGSTYDTLWVVHALGACAFIAYVPLSRLIHACVTPLGRLANSQVEIATKKKLSTLRGLLCR